MLTALHLGQLANLESLLHFLRQPCFWTLPSMCSPSSCLGVLLTGASHTWTWTPATLLKCRLSFSLSVAGAGASAFLYALRWGRCWLVSKQFSDHLSLDHRAVTPWSQLTFQIPQRAPRLLTRTLSLIAPLQLTQQPKGERRGSQNSGLGPESCPKPTHPFSPAPNSSPFSHSHFFLRLIITSLSKHKLQPDKQSTDFSINIDCHEKQKEKREQNGKVLYIQFIFGSKPIFSPRLVAWFPLSHPVCSLLLHQFFLLL